jgi:hypothetical protein
LYVIQGLLGSLGRPINIGYFPLNKGIITEKQQSGASPACWQSFQNVQRARELP